MPAFTSFRKSWCICAYSTTLAAIQSDGTIGNSAVFFSDGIDGYLYIKGAGTGTDFDGTAIQFSTDGVNE